MGDLTFSLQSEYDRLEAIISNISDVVSVMDAEARLLYKSPNCEKLFGWTPEDLSKGTVWDVVHPDDLHRVKYEFSEVLKQKDSTRSFDFLYLCKDMKYRLVRLTAINKVEDPNIKGVLMNYHDITSHKRILEKLIESEGKYRSVFSAVKDPIILIDLETKMIIDANDSATMIYGYSNEEFKKLNAVALFNGKVEQQKKDGSFFPAEVTTSHFEFDGKQVLLVVVKDLTSTFNEREQII